MTIKDTLSEAINILKKANIDAPAIDTGVMLCHVLNCDRAYLYTHSERELRCDEYNRYINFINKRAKGMPLQYITGHQEFMSLDFLVTPDVLIPLHDTEILVETVINHVNNRINNSQLSTTNQQQSTLNIQHLTSSTQHSTLNTEPSTLNTQNSKLKTQHSTLDCLDLGTGSGCIAVSLAYYIKDCRFIAVDISDKALEVARRNARFNGVEDKIHFMEGNLFSALTEQPPEYNFFDVIVSNPPYIPLQEIKELDIQVKNFEPVQALDGGPDGLDFYRRIIKESANFLKPGGMLAFEAGYNQAEAVAGLMKVCFNNIRIIKDLANIDRVITGEFGNYPED